VVGDFAPIPEEVIGLGDDVVVLGRYTATRKETGRPLDVPFATSGASATAAPSASTSSRHARLGRGAAE
jgi:hypothetical protein